MRMNSKMFSTVLFIKRMVRNDSNEFYLSPVLLESWEGLQMPPSFVFQEMAAVENCPSLYDLDKTHGSFLCLLPTRADTDPPHSHSWLYEWFTACPHWSFRITYRFNHTLCFLRPLTFGPPSAWTNIQPSLRVSHKGSPEEQMNRVHVDESMCIL